MSARERLVTIDVVTRLFPADVLAALAELYGPGFAVNTVASSGPAETLTTAPVQDVTMSENCTLTFPTVTSEGWTFRLILRGAFAPTFPASVDWPDGTPPTYSAPTIYEFTTVDTGTTWLGRSLGKAYA